MSADGWLDPGTCGIRLEAFHRLTGLVGRSASDLDTLASRLYTILSTAGADVSPALEIRRTARWAAAASADLRRRDRLAHALDSRHPALARCVPAGNYLRMPDRLTDQLATVNGHEAAALLTRATTGDRAALAALLDHEQDATDPYFAAALLGSLGPSALLNAPFALAHLLHRAEPAIAPPDARRTLALLSTALATATTPGSPASLGDAYLTSLAATASTGFPAGVAHPHHVGHQALATLLTHTTRTFSDPFFRTVGQSMIAYTRHAPAWKPLPDVTALYGLTHLLTPPNTPPPADILQPLLTAASATTTGAQILLEHPLTEPTSNLHYLLHTRRPLWAATDKGQALARTLTTALSTPTPLSRSLFTEFLDIQGTQTLPHITYKEGHHLKIDESHLNDLSALRATTADLLITHLDDVINEIDAAPASSDEGYERMRLYLALLADASLDDHVFDHLVKAHVEALHHSVEDYTRTGRHGHVISYTDALSRLFALRTEMSAALGDNVRASNEDLKRWIDLGVGWVSPSGYLEKIGVRPEAASVIDGEMQEKVSAFLFGQVSDHSQDKNTERERTRQAALLNRMVERLMVAAHAGQLTYEPSMEGYSFTDGHAIAELPWSDEQLREFDRWSRNDNNTFVDLKQDLGASINSGHSKAIDPFSFGEGK
ncbi:hypothetical protein [Actinocorallia longicatena]|uniref:Uncharacterized protein n=1 Tax=Actinocorallia longicatena TaxID=111803 RepID=A0ABP6Q1E6_9ACTN